MFRSSQCLSRVSGFASALGLCILSGCGGGSSQQPVAPTSRYVITDIGANFTNSYAYGLNNQGQVIGGGSGDAQSNSAPVPAFPMTFVYANGKVTNLNAPILKALNDNGQIVGDSGQYQNGAITPITGRVSGTANTVATLQATAINNAGRIAGSFLVGTQGATQVHHAAVYVNGQLTDLGTLGESPSTVAGQSPISSYASGLNNAGQVVGISATGALQSGSVPVRHAFVWQNDKLSDLGTLGGNFSEASAINNNGLIVGACTLPDVKSAHIVMWQNGNIRDIDPSGLALSAASVNDAGQIVGTRRTSASTGAPASAASVPAYHAYVYQRGQFTDLNTVIPANSGWELTSATAINNKGQICGTGSFKGASHAFLLTPR